jgi:hypothetical protein
VKHRLVKLTLVSIGAVTAAPAFAESPAAPARVAAATTTATAPAAAPTTPSAQPPRPQAANTRGAPAASSTTVTAAGSVIVILADGIVANATIAQIRPPAPGFVYER